MSRSTIVRRSLAGLFAVSLIAATAGSPVSASAAVQESSARQAASTYPTKWRCNDNDVCTRLTGRKATKFSPTWSGAVENKTSRRIKDAQCKSTESKTTTWGTSVSMGGELKAGVFATINATISGSVSKSMTSQIEFSVPFDVPPHTTTSCTQGFKIYRWKGQRWDRVRQSVQEFTVRAPRTVVWRIKDVN